MLGPKNFLSKAKELERDPTFMFMEEAGSNQRQNAHYLYEASCDGRQLMLAVLETSGYEICFLSRAFNFPVYAFRLGNSNLQNARVPSKSLYGHSFANGNRRQAHESYTGISTIRLERWDLGGSNGVFMEQKQ